MSLDFDLIIKVDTGSKESYVVGLFSANITHNLNKMASKAGLYELLWRPEENNFNLANDIILPLEIGLNKLKNDPDTFKQYNPENGWGDYDNLVKFAEKVLSACKEHPKAKIKVCR